MDQLRTSMKKLKTVKNKHWSQADLTRKIVQKGTFMPKCLKITHPKLVQLRKPPYL
jgi:hypothetical protein